MTMVDRTGEPEDSGADSEQRAVDEAPADDLGSFRTLRCQASVKLEQLRWKIASWILTLPLSVLLFLYVNEIILEVHRHVSKALPPPDANAVVSVLSQGFAQLVQGILKDIPDILRWKLALRPLVFLSLHFCKLSGAMQWLGIDSKI